MNELTGLTTVELDSLSEEAFAEFVDRTAQDPAQQEFLTEFLREDHPVYRERGTAAVIRMRGWILISLAKQQFPPSAVLYLLEELDTAIHAYAVAAAACALRSLPKPDQLYAPFLLRALTNIRYHDESVSLEAYGEYPDESTDTCAVGEILKTIRWLGPLAGSIQSELRNVNGLSISEQKELDHLVSSPQAADQDTPPVDDCCQLPAGVSNLFTWMRGTRADCTPVEQTVFEDQSGNLIRYGELFTGGPTVVVFFYTRCDNPLKCSLTITKLAHVQKELERRGLASQIRTAAITYDPEYDHAQRLAQYGKERNFQTGAQHRLLRTVEGFEPIKKHFKLGVNYTRALVNRHRIEVFILDSAGAIAASFERLRWDEAEIVEKAVEMLHEAETCAKKTDSTSVFQNRVFSAIGPFAALGAAFFPKCPFCWAAYASLFGVVGLEQIPFSPWLYPVLILVMLINLLSVWLRCQSTKKMYGFYFVFAGAVAILAGSFWNLPLAATSGVISTFAGSLISALKPD